MHFCSPTTIGYWQPRINLTVNSDQTIWQMLREFTTHISARRRKQFVLVIALMLVGAAAELLTLGAVIPFVSLMADPEAAFQFPLLQQFFSAIGWRDPDVIVLPMTLLFLAMVAVAAAIRLLLLYVSNRYVFALGYDIGVSLYRRVLDQPYSYHIQQNTSETIAAINKVQAVLGGAVKPVMEGLIAIVLAAAILAALLWIDPLATLAAALIFTVLYIGIGFLTRFRLKSNSRKIASAQTDRVRCVQEGLGSIRDVKLDDSQDEYVRTFSRVDRKLRTAQANNNFLKQSPRYIIEAVGTFLIIGLAWFLSHQAGGLVAALPVLGALALGAQRLLPLLQKIYNGWSRLTGNHQIFADVLKLLSLPLSERSMAGTASIPFQREIRLRGIGFHYPSADEQVLTHIDLEIPRGSRIGVVGPTGSGKSTLIDIIMGLLEPTEGQLMVDGRQIDASNRRAWQDHIAHVPQHIFLTDATIAENIALGIPKSRICMERVAQAARYAQIADFIEASPAGYQSRVGERGIQLSGGQRQRIGIARAIYRQADVLVLDEATSALDADTEDRVMTQLDFDDGGLTIIMIAHRTQTLKRCDRVIQLDAGNIQGDGTYEQLHHDALDMMN